MKTAILMTAGIALLAFAGLGGSDHGCNGAITDVGGLVYIDDRGASPAEGNLWIYLESNGTPGLQSGGLGPLNGIAGLIHSDPCNHASHDTLLY